MKTQQWVLLLLIVGLVAMSGCREAEESNCTDCGEPWGLGIVQLHMAADTLTFLPGDSVLCDGWVLVMDGAGNVRTNKPVRIGLLEPFGSIELLNGTDSTDATGHVYFRFRSYNQTGTTTVSAECLGKVDYWPLTVLPARSPVGYLNIVLSRHNLVVAPLLEDSVHVTVVIADSLDQGLAGIVPDLHASGGRLSPIAATDATGKAAAWWYSNHEYGVFRIWFAVDTLLVSDSVAVLTDSLAARIAQPGRGGS